jgi:curved DNA-binding protein CbpA
MTRETRAIARLQAAQTAYDALRAESERRAYIRGSDFDNANNAAANELNAALWPFTTGKYQMPADMGFGLTADA